MGVKFSPQGVLTLHGVSCDEDPKPLYNQLKEWAKEYISRPAEKTEFYIRLKYFNTSSAKCLMELLELMTLLTQSQKTLVITWYYEDGDEDMFDSIKVFEDLIHHKIEPVLVSSYSR